ncbi:hypothetical protein HAX54_023274, partial [Datura stramonium]|nr:hypothetical protein [Datura stramonium]
EEVHDRPAKNTFKSQRESNISEKNMPDNEDNDEESHGKNVQNKGRNLKIIKWKE